MIGMNATNISTKAEPETLCLALRAREAAKALAISERLLWGLTQRGRIPHIRLGKAILYPVGPLREWLKREAGQAVEKGDEKTSEKSSNSV